MAYQSVSESPILWVLVLGIALIAALTMLAGAYFIARLLVAPAVAREKSLMDQIVEERLARAEERATFETRLKIVESEQAKANARIAELRSELEHERSDKARIAQQYAALVELVSNMRSGGNGNGPSPTAQFSDVSDDEETRFRTWLAARMDDADLDVLAANAGVPQSPKPMDFGLRILMAVGAARRMNKLPKLMEEAQKMRPGVRRW